MFNISCWFVILFTLNLVPGRFKYITIKCECKLYPPLLTSTLNGSTLTPSFSGHVYLKITTYYQVFNNIFLSNILIYVMSMNILNTGRWRILMICLGVKYRSVTLGISEEIHKSGRKRGEQDVPEYFQLSKGCPGTLSPVRKGYSRIFSLIKVVLIF